MKEGTLELDRPELECFVSGNLNDFCQRKDRTELSGFITYLKHIFHRFSRKQNVEL